MNKLNGHIVKVNEFDGLQIIHTNVNTTVFKSIIIHNPKNSFSVGNQINVLFKATEVIISKLSPVNISLQNQFECQIIELKKGKLLTDLKLKYESAIIHSIITTDSVERLNLHENETVTVCIKTNDILLEKC